MDSAKPLHILLVEDSPDDAELILLELAERWPDLHSRRVDTADGLRQALAGQDWDAVISDCNLPRFNAEEALVILREQGQDLPFLVVSGFIGEESAAAMMKAGAHDFIRKDNLARLTPAIARELREAALRREHRQAQEALRNSEKRLRAITAALGEAVFVTNAEGLLQSMNPEAERLLGWRESELLGKFMHDAVHRHGPDQPPVAQGLCGTLRAIKQGTCVRIEDDIYLHKNGSTVPVAYVATPLFEDGRLVGAVTAAQNIASRKRDRQELLESRRRLQELSAHLQSVREEERTRIARELHDELGQVLTAFKMDVSWLGGKLPGADAPIQAKLDGMSKLIDDTLDWVRRMSSDLRPIMLDDLGLRAAVEWLLEDFSRRHGIAATLDACTKDFRLAPEYSTAAFRIVQECLTNVARHAQASRVEVTLRCAGCQLEIAVSDDGRGFNPQLGGQRKSFGLLGIRERAASLDGDCHIVTSTEGGGTTVSVRLPLTTPCQDDQETDAS